MLFVALPHLLQHRLMWWVCNKFGCNYSDYTTINLRISSQLKGINAQGLSNCYCSKGVAAERSYSTFIIINLLIFVV